MSIGLDGSQKLVVSIRIGKIKIGLSIVFTRSKVCACDSFLLLFFLITGMEVLCRGRKVREVDAYHKRELKKPDVPKNKKPCILTLDGSDSSYSISQQSIFPPKPSAREPKSTKPCNLNSTTTTITTTIQSSAPLTIKRFRRLRIKRHGTKPRHPIAEPINGHWLRKRSVRGHGQETCEVGLHMPERIRQTHLEQGRKQRLWLARVRGVGDGVGVWAEGFENGAQGVGLGVGGAEGDEVVEDEVD